MTPAHKLIVTTPGGEVLVIDIRHIRKGAATPGSCEILLEFHEPTIIRKVNKKGSHEDSKRTNR